MKLHKVINTGNSSKKSNQSYPVARDHSAKLLSNSSNHHKIILKPKAERSEDIKMQDQSQGANLDLKNFNFAKPEPVYDHLKPDPKPVGRKLANTTAEPVVTNQAKSPLSMSY